MTTISTGQVTATVDDSRYSCCFFAYLLCFFVGEEGTTVAIFTGVAFAGFGDDTATATAGDDGFLCLASLLAILSFSPSLWASKASTSAFAVSRHCCNSAWDALDFIRRKYSTPNCCSRCWIFNFKPAFMAFPLTFVATRPPLSFKELAIFDMSLPNMITNYAVF